jgi:hypothetical protein
VRERIGSLRDREKGKESGVSREGNGRERERERERERDRDRDRGEGEGKCETHK